MSKLIVTELDRATLDGMYKLTNDDSKKGEKSELESEWDT